MSKIDTVIFDLDQTLLDKEQSLINFAKYQYERFSLHAFIVDKHEFIEKFTQLNNILMPKEDVYNELIDFFKIENALFTPLLDDLNHNFHKYSIGFPGLHEMLLSLKQSGYKLGMITNGREFYQRNKVIALGIMELFDDIVISGAVNLRKPDHAIFQLSLCNLSSSAAKSVFVGDNLKADIIPANEMGMRTILKSNDSTFSYPDAICNDLLEIHAIIDRFSEWE
ncbi:HAD family hydrolase [Bacillus sp. FJAT-28004]|uniref:HAD family hydrolase n=1 Tax=Bacillus sp. FJAT-28004 TaxID=1679165 RepID=UPI0006B60DE2|nr:HAD family hydrolase [Bacillus sp. FJAT-28004]